MLFLTEPSSLYKESFIEAIREFQQEGRYRNTDIRRLSDDFEGYVQRIIAQRDHTNMRPEYVPFIQLWLIKDNDYIGLLNVRHELNEFFVRIGGHIGYEIRPTQRGHGYGKEILRLGLKQAKLLGLSRALVTCDENNIGSKRVIEYNGGQFENAVEVEGSPIKKLRYWIDLS